MANSIITATGSYIPTAAIPNSHFLANEFYGADGIKLERPNPEIIAKLNEITGIKERRYVIDELTTSDIATIAAERALEGQDKESLDYIIVGQNLGDLKADNNRTDIVPSIAARVKHKLRIKNPYTIAFDIPFGCPGWLQGMIMADYYIKSGDAQRILVIGAEILSRVCDPHDIDSMIYADGAGATLVQATDQDVGILSHVARSDTYDNAYLLYLGKSYNPKRDGNELFIKMDGHEIYKYAVRNVPQVVQKNLEKSGIGLNEVKKVLIHQANGKMDEAILKKTV
jgi:3-oxoacyl-[acyl-carrier-protein] synthase-3